MFSRRSYLRAFLLVVWVPLSGCNAITGTTVPRSQGPSDSGGAGVSDQAESPGSDIGEGNSNLNGGEGAEPGTNAPDNPGTVVPPIAQPGELPDAGKEALPDFSIKDVNPASARYGDAVSPRDYLGRVSAWYFGHAT